MMPEEAVRPGKHPVSQVRLGYRGCTCQARQSGSPTSIQAAQ